MSAEHEDLLQLLQPRWPAHWSGDPQVRQALTQLAQDAREGHPTSLPYVQAAVGQIAWLSTAGTLRELREYLDDARGWLVKADASALTAEVRQPKDAAGPLGALLRVVSPQGYVRWDTSLAGGAHTLVRLGRMHQFLRTRPDLSRHSTPSVAALRLEFISALGVGDWDRADACIGEIDHWNLDHAPGTLHMRIRLLQARGQTRELFQFVCANQAWEFANPRRIAAAIVGAVDACAIQPELNTSGLQAAFDLFRQRWYPKLVQCISDARGEGGVARPLAFAATVDGDHQSLASLRNSLPDGVWQFLQKQMPGSPLPTEGATAQRNAEQAPSIQTDAEQPNTDPALPATTPDSSADAVVEGASSLGAQSDAPAVAEGIRYWTALHLAIAQVHAPQARVLIASLDSQLLDDPVFLSCAPDALLEIVSDPQIDADAGARSLLYEVLAALVDAFVLTPGFPRLAHLEVYLTLLDSIVLLKAGATSDADSQLVLGLVSAAANLRADASERCEQIVRAWWQGRAVVPRLDWLAAALDSLGPLGIKTDGLVSLFVDGMALAARKGLQFAPTKLAMWRTIGQMLELSAADLQQYLAPLTTPADQAQQDPLAVAGLRHVAVVSLRKESAEEAAKELRARTHAKVSVVTSLVADADTDLAVSADLILYVWAASTHATYRSFDSCREKLEYVQGTGASSIVLAAERWVQRHVGR